MGTYHQSMVEAETLLPLIERYCKRTGITTRSFGNRCLNDGSFVLGLHRGRMIRQSTFDKVTEWILKRDSFAAEPKPAVSDEPVNAALRKDGPAQPLTGREIKRVSVSAAASDDLRDAINAVAARHGRKIGTSMETARLLLLNGRTSLPVAA